MTSTSFGPQPNVNESATPVVSQQPYVVVGFDGSRASRSALARAAEEAADRAMPLTVLTVVSTARDPRLSDAGNAGRIRTAREDLHHSASTAVDELHAGHPGLISEVVTLLDTDVEAIHEVLDRCGLLLIGDRNRADRRAFLLGTISRTLVRGVHCPVLVMVEPPNDGQLATIDGPVVVGLAGTPSDVAVLRAAATEAALRSGRLLVVHSYEAAHRRDVLGARPAAEIAVHNALAAAELDRTLEVQVELSDEAPANALLRAGAASDLIVVGTRGPLALARLALDSVSRAVLDAATSAVLIIPQD